MGKIKLRLGILFVLSFACVWIFKCFLDNARIVFTSIIQFIGIISLLHTQ